MKKMVVPGIAMLKKIYIYLFKDVLLYNVSIQFVSWVKSPKYPMKKSLKRKGKAALERSQEVVITINSATDRPGECLPQAEEPLPGKLAGI